MFDAPTSATTAEYRLYSAVVARAIEDLFSSDAVYASTPEQARIQRREALSFLTDTHGAWAASRADYCEAVGVDPNALREGIIRILDGADPPQETFHRYRFDLARAMWRERKSDALREAEARAQQQAVVARRRQAEAARVAEIEAATAFDDLLATPDVALPTGRTRDAIARRRSYVETRVRTILAHGPQPASVLINAMPDVVNPAFMRDVLDALVQAGEVEVIGEAVSRKYSLST